MTVLITGALGQLGSDLAALLPGALALSREEMAIDDRQAVERIFSDARPSVVYNCAAYNAVDRAESEADEAFAANTVGPGVLAQACAAGGARLVHFSTNFVFDGALERPYIESDQPAPLSVYGRSKLGGEEAVLGALPDALVIRVTSLFGVRGSVIKGGSFPERIVRSAREGRPLRIVADQMANPTYTADLALAVLKVVDAGTTGIVHLAPADCCSWHEFAVAALEAAGVSAEVDAIKTADLAAPARRPLRACLGSERVAPLRSWREGLGDWWSEVERTQGARTA